MSEQIKVMIVGSGDAKLLASLREKIEAKGHIVVGVGTVGRANHGRDLPNPDVFGELLALTLRNPEPCIEPMLRIGKGQRKANKANRWR